MSAAAPMLITTKEHIKTLLQRISACREIYIDVEGKNLSRYGTLSLISVLFMPAAEACCIDVQALNDNAFDTSDNNGKTIRSMLEDEQIKKYFWDVRNDADALWAHHKINLKGVTDIQLLENASRSGRRRFLSGLQKAVERDLALSYKEKQHFIQTKDAVKKLMTDDVFAKRPLDPTTVEYCTNDVKYLPRLKDIYMRRISPEWLKKAIKESERRVEEACSSTYIPHSGLKALGPWG